MVVAVLVFSESLTSTVAVIGCVVSNQLYRFASV